MTDNPGYVNDPPSPAADLLDSLIEDAKADPDGTFSLLYSGIHDTNPAGIGDAAVHVRDTATGAQFLLVAVHVEAMGALDNRSYVRRLLAEKMPHLTEVIAGAERILDTELAAS